MYDFTEQQIERYSRHILLQDVGVEGQEKILNAKVLVIGAGGLGAPVSLYLAAAGVGTIGIVDADVVDLSNLQRQVIHFTNDVGKAKVESAKEKMLAINPDVKVETYHTYLDSSNALDIISNYDFIIDGTDNFPVKFLINDACVMAGKPFSHGGILRFTGQTFTHLPGTACYRCMFSVFHHRINVVAQSIFILEFGNTNGFITIGTAGNTAKHLDLMLVCLFILRIDFFG